MSKSILQRTKERAGRTRSRLARVGKGRPRLSVHRSSKNISVQIIDDRNSKTIASASTLEKDFRSDTPKGSDTDAASAIGKLIAERALKAGVEQVIFDRGGYIYHGRVKALAEAARDGGLKF
ncbi:50S ribosomal protein L18 [Parvularcula sp. IMCC14364]|uniref:50S ribosomal protein L18 n=1 Tax=Parvularcula sp. IMCC14364 TaxID=3067902 RepID=UPI00274207AC|nr:50S ribosomal protein L18 [Parvularcula sp. IMCC14364]